MAVLYGDGSGDSSGIESSGNLGIAAAHDSTGVLSLADDLEEGGDGHEENGRETGHEDGQFVKKIPEEPQKEEAQDGADSVLVCE
ncbi:unnamed protein product [Calypogeia fissa]